MLMRIFVIFFAVAIAFVRGEETLDGWSPVNSGRCSREPTGTRMPKTPGDNGFHIGVSGNPQKYVPGEKYTVSLKGWKTQVSVQKFIGFMLVVEPSSSERPGSVGAVGTLQLYSDTYSKFSPDCPNAVIDTSPIPKSEIQVLWTAPPAGSGCVQLKALLVEQRDIWYKDEGGLSKELCEEEQENLDEQPDILDECCACDEAKYEVVFEGLWNRHTHPKDFPTNEWLTHFSDIIGASHSPDYTMWEYGGLASEGLQYVAEWGSTRNMETELKAQSAHIRTIIKARGLWYPNVNGKTFAVFRVDRHHHLMSLVSMLGPSPDWVVGLSKLELCLKNCSWITQRVFNLYPWDAGTDSGVTYQSPNLPTHPRERIRQISSSYPNNEKSPFYDPSGQPMKPVAQLTITRQRLYEKSCADAAKLPPNHEEPETYDSEDSRPECAVGAWGPFSPCSVSCGKGLRTRRRTYLLPSKAQMMDCTEQLEQNEMCAAKVPVCDGSFEDSGESTFPPKTQRRCATSPWTSWSECSVTCGKGTHVRTRTYLDPSVHKVCTLNTHETSVCMADVPFCEDDDGGEGDDFCAVTVWSDWSPCSVTCGKGMRFKIRQYLDQDATATCHVDLQQREVCMAEKLDCNISPEEMKEICTEVVNVGPCRGYFPRWYFDAGKGMCLQFIYGGCRGNKNNFERYEDCNEMCALLKGADSSTGNGNSVTFRHDLEPEPIDCMLSEWSPWSACSVTCGKGKMERRRMIKVHAQNGGKPCVRKTIQRKKCTMVACPKRK